MASVARRYVDRLLAGDPTKAQTYTSVRKVQTNYDISARSHPTDEDVVVVPGSRSFQPYASAGYKESNLDSVTLSRRSLLQAIAATMASAAMPLPWSEIVCAVDEAHVTAQGGELKPSFLSAGEAADVEAVASHIIPTNDSPGAREAGVVHFIDRSLATSLSRLAGDYRAQLSAFQTTVRERHPSIGSFASLTSAQQMEHLKGVDETPFFMTTRLLTLLGMFSLPVYGGNRDGVGWKLLGFEDAHTFGPPFGYYDRGYSGFVIDPLKIK